MSTQGKDSRTPDPYGGFLFTLQVASPGSGGGGGDDATVVGCSEVSGLAFELEVESLKVGGMNGGDLQLPGPGRPAARLVLKRGLADRSVFWRWYLAIADSRIERRTVTVSLMDTRGGATDWRWSFRDACPVKWTGPDLRSTTSAIGFEAVELVHRGLQRSATG
jgi:phage tail-like protein